MTRRLLVLLALALAAPTTARAAYLFDNLAAAGGQTNGPLYGVSAQAGLGATLTFSSNTTISDFDVYTGLIGPGQLRFVIFGSTQGTAPLFVSAIRSFATDRVPGGDVVATYKNSGTLNFTFLAGQTYNVGFVSNVSTTNPTISGSLNQNGITAASDSAFFGQNDVFSSPNYIGRQLGQVIVRLNFTAPPGVPEPSSLLGLAVGCGLLGLVTRRRAA